METGNFVVGIFSVMLGVLSLVNVWLIFVLSQQSKTISALQKADGDVRSEMTAIRVLVADSYLKRDEFNTVIKTQTAEMSRRFDRVESKMDDKADKTNGR